jgi:hypothetical protein
MSLLPDRGTGWACSTLGWGSAMGWAWSQSTLFTVLGASLMVLSAVLTAAYWSGAIKD